jgi:hypothetical protein
VRSSTVLRTGPKFNYGAARASERMTPMHSRLAQIFALLVVGVAAPCVHAATVTFDYFAPNVGLTSVSGFGSFSYNGALTSIGLGNLTAFAFELDLTSPGSIPPTATLDFGLLDLLSFSASASGGAITALSLATGYEAATNTSNFDENQKSLVVTSLAINGAANFNDDDVLNRITLFDTGTIVITPEPSTTLMAGAGALLLAFWRRSRRAPQA